MDDNGKEYGEERVRQFVQTHRGKDAASILQGILDDVRTHDATFPRAMIQPL